MKSHEPYDDRKSVIQRVMFGAHPQKSAAFSPDGKLIFAAAENDVLVVVKAPR